MSSRPLSAKLVAMTERQAVRASFVRPALPACAFVADVVADRRVTIRIVDRDGQLCRGADVVLLAGAELLGQVPASTGQVQVTLPAEAPLEVRAIFEGVERVASVSAAETAAAVRFEDIVAQPTGFADQALTWVARQPGVRAVVVRVGSIVLAPIALGLPPLSGLVRGQVGHLEKFDLDKLLPRAPVPRCPDGASGSPCVECRAGKISVRICG